MDLRFSPYSLFCQPSGPSRPGTGWDYWASSLDLRVVPPALGREVLQDSGTAIFSLILLSSPGTCWLEGTAQGHLRFLRLAGPEPPVGEFLSGLLSSEGPHSRRRVPLPAVPLRFHCHGPERFQFLTPAWKCCAVLMLQTTCPSAGLGRLLRTDLPLAGA